MPDGPGTVDFPLEQVHTFAHLRALLNRLHERAGRPSMGTIRRSTQAVPGLAPLSRARLLRILRGPGRPSREELRAMLHAYRVPQGQLRRWDAAWVRAAGERGLTPPDPGTGAGPDIPGPDVLRAVTARRLLEVRERCAERLRRLKGELGAAHAQADPGDPDSGIRLARSLDLALRRLQDIIDEACAEVLAVEVDAVEVGAPAAGGPVRAVDPGLPPAAVPAWSHPPDGGPGPATTGANGAATGGAPTGGAPTGGAPTGGAATNGGAGDGEPGDEALAWVSAVQEHVPLPVLAHLLKVIGEVPLFNHIAQERPQLMAELLAALPPGEAARWLQAWEPESAAEALAVAEPPQAAAHVTLMPPEAGAALMARMSQRRAAAILAAMRRGPAADRLIAMGSTTGAALLEWMDRGAATVRLLLIQQLDPELAAKFLNLMSEQAASECLDRMDQEAANQRQARELLENIRDQRQEQPKT